MSSLWEASLTTHLALREQVFLANLRIVDAGLVVLTFGNCSGVDRAAGVMAIKPSGVPYEELGPQSMVIVDLETGLRRGLAAAVIRHANASRSLPALSGGGRHRPHPLAVCDGMGTSPPRNPLLWYHPRRPLLWLGTGNTHADHPGDPGRVRTVYR